jgi:2-polyprenyl-3-methyl-5-hydroxy-6-metoxy-1,4-benzoquinol methylase
MICTSENLQAARWVYFLEGLVRRFQTEKQCPCCGARSSRRVDRKFFYTLEKCEHCQILYRYPYDSPEEMRQYYQRQYSQAGLTTDLPTEADLQRLLEQNFRDTSKDFSRVIAVLKSLRIAPGARLLDYGANWGYGAVQLKRAGYHTEAYEISKPRAGFGRMLGFEIQTDFAKIQGPFDAIYSGHVLEHVPNPLAVLCQQLDWVRPGGFVIAHTPNGSQERIQRSFASFHRHWGKVHPVLLGAEFVQRNFFRHPCYLCTASDLTALQKWSQDAISMGRLDGEEILIILRKSIP